MLKPVLFIAFLAHCLCAYTDCLLMYGKKGRIDFKCLKDPEKMTEAFAELPLKNTTMSMLLGVLALTAMSFGYYSLALWVKDFSQTLGAIMLIAMPFFLVAGAAHHVFFGAVEWFYIRFGRTNEAREAVLDFIKQTISTMYGCYIGIAGFMIPLFIAVVSGMTDLPRWCCIFNTAVFFLLFTPTKLPAKGNIAGALTFLGLFLFI